MSETANHHTAEVETPHLRGVPEGLQLTTLDKLVNRVADIRADFARQDETDDYSAFKAQRLDELLKEQGLKDDENDPKSQEDYHFAKGIYTEVSALNKASWLGLPEGQDYARRELVAEAVREWYADRAETAATEQSTSEAKKGQESDDPAKLEKAKLEVYNDLEAVTKKYAEQVAERSKRMVESAATTADIRASREELSELIGGIATGLMDELEAEGVSWDEIPTQIDTFIAEQTDSVISQMEAHRMAEYNKARPVFQKFYDKWASWGQEKGLITKGKLKKAAVFAIPGAALGAALVPLAGIVGFGAVTGALAVTGGRSIGRHLAGAKLDAVANSKRVAAEQSADIRERAAKIDKATHDDLLNIIDDRTEAYRKRNLRRTAGGLAIAMTVGLLTAKGADILADNVDNWSFGKLGELGDGKDEIDTNGPVELPDRDGDGIPDSTDPDRDGDGVPNRNDPAPNNPNIPRETGPDNLTRNELFDGRFGTRELTPEGHEALAEQLNGYRVKSGDSVWSLSEQFLHEQGVQNPTVYEIDATKDVLLKELRASGNADSRGWLSVGDTIKIK